MRVAAQTARSCALPARGGAAVAAAAVPRRGVLSGLALLALAPPPPAHADEGLPDDWGIVNGHLRPCKAGRSCVSTSPGSAPSNWMAAWRLERPPGAAGYVRLRTAALASGRDSALSGVSSARLLREEALPRGARYLAVAHAREDGDAEVLEFVLLPDNASKPESAPATVCFRAAAARRRRDPPGCAGVGCINGPAQRGRLAALRDALDASPLEPDDDKVWVPLLLH